MKTAAHRQPRSGFSLALISCVGYIIVMPLAFLATGVRYTSPEQLAGSLDALWRLILPLGIGAIILIGLITRLDWWHAICTEPPHLRLGSWFRIVPWVALITIALGIEYRALPGIGWLTVGFILFTVLVVGFCEELVFRGIAVVGFRDRWPEPLVWLSSTLLFAALHLPNMLLGLAPSEAMNQVVGNIAAGSLFYVVRRASGSIIPAMLVHAGTDFLGLTVRTMDYTPAFAAMVLQVLVLVGLLLSWRIAFPRAAKPKTPAVAAG